MSEDGSYGDEQEQVEQEPEDGRELRVDEGEDLRQEDRDQDCALEHREGGGATALRDSSKSDEAEAGRNNRGGDACGLDERPLALAQGIARDVAAEPERLKEEYGAEKGAFDVMFEASGNQHALSGALDVIRPGGVIVQIGVGGQFTLPMNVVVAKEFDLRGSFRFHEEFDWAVAMIGSGRIDLSPLLTATIPVDRAVEAFDLASDKSKAIKVQLDFA